jgi:hypothetical protein
MDNNTQIETVREAADKYWEANKYKSDYPHCPFSFQDGANWQKQQDEAKYNSLSVYELLLEREKLEKLIRSKDEMALVNYELKQLEIN